MPFLCQNFLQMLSKTLEQPGSEVQSGHAHNVPLIESDIGSAVEQCYKAIDWPKDMDRFCSCMSENINTRIYSWS